MKKVLSTLLSLYTTVATAQFEPSAGQSGSTAMFEDSSAFIQWAKTCTLHRGYMNISNPSAGLASVGDESAPIGKAGENGVVSLGDGGVAVLSFDPPIRNEQGFDFAVFENGFKDAGGSLDFLEYAFVEVSSDGINFVRFPSEYVGDTTKQVTSFQPTDTRLYHNLAGKYTAGYGTPFDLEELKDDSQLDLSHISHVKIVDVVGSIQPAFASRDSKYRVVNDPWPTEFPSSGFDLDAVGVTHVGEPLALHASSLPYGTNVFPNPASTELTIVSFSDDVKVELKDLKGIPLKQQEFSFRSTLDTSDLLPGIYVLSIASQGAAFSQKVVIQ
jgi:hypothetical protein